MKYTVIVTFVNGGTSGLIVEADSLTKAWEIVMLTFNPGCLRKIEIAEVVLTQAGG